MIRLANLVLYWEDQPSFPRLDDLGWQQDETRPDTRWKDFAAASVRVILIRREFVNRSPSAAARVPVPYFTEVYIWPGEESLPGQDIRLPGEKGAGVEEIMAVLVELWADLEAARQ